MTRERKEGSERGEEGDPEESRRIKSVVGLNEMHLSEVETRFCRPLLSSPSSLVPESPRSPEKAGERNMVK